MDFVGSWSRKTEIAAKTLMRWIGVPSSKYHDWQHRYGRDNGHNGNIHRDHWVDEGEKEAAIAFHQEHPLEGYRCLTYMMMDADVAVLSPAITYRILREAGVLRRWSGKASKKGTGFDQPQKAHEHWHIDVSYLNVSGTFYYLCSVLDGYSRAIVHWEIRESMK